LNGIPGPLYYGIYIKFKPGCYQLGISLFYDYGLGLASPEVLSYRISFLIDAGTNIVTYYLLS
jgi:hypothetical protein